MTLTLMDVAHQTVDMRSCPLSIRDALSELMTSSDTALDGAEEATAKDVMQTMRLMGPRISQDSVNWVAILLIRSLLRTFSKRSHIIDLANTAVDSVADNCASFLVALGSPQNHEQLPLGDLLSVFAERRPVTQLLLPTSSSLKKYPISPAMTTLAVSNRKDALYRLMHDELRKHKTHDNFDYLVTGLLLQDDSASVSTHLGWLTEAGILNVCQFGPHKLTQPETYSWLKQIVVASEKYLSVNMHLIKMTSTDRSGVGLAKASGMSSRSHPRWLLERCVMQHPCLNDDWCAQRIDSHPAEFPECLRVLFREYQRFTGDGYVDDGGKEATQTLSERLSRAWQHNTASSATEVFLRCVPHLQNTRNSSPQNVILDWDGLLQSIALSLNDNCEGLVAFSVIRRRRLNLPRSTLVTAALRDGGDKWIRENRKSTRMFVRYASALMQTFKDDSQTKEGKGKHTPPLFDELCSLACRRDEVFTMESTCERAFDLAARLEELREPEVSYVQCDALLTMSLPAEIVRELPSEVYEWLRSDGLLLSERADPSTSPLDNVSLPALLCTYRKEGESINNTEDRAREAVVSAVCFLRSLGITEHLVFGLVVDGSLGGVICGYQPDSGDIQLIDSHAKVYDISRPSELRRFLEFCGRLRDFSLASLPRMTDAFLQTRMLPAWTVSREFDEVLQRQTVGDVGYASDGDASDTSWEDGESDFEDADWHVVAHDDHEL